MFDWYHFTSIFYDFSIHHFKSKAVTHLSDLLIPGFAI